MTRLFRIFGIVALLVCTGCVNIYTCGWSDADVEAILAEAAT
jgi:hypothetical protein